MKTFRLLVFLFCLVAASVKAAPIVQSPWTTTGVPLTARTGLQAASITNAFFYNTLSSGAFGTARFRFLQNDANTFTLFDGTTVQDILTWSAIAEGLIVSGDLTAGAIVANTSITLGGVTRTDWPGGGGDTYNLAVSTNYGNTVPDIASLITNAPGKSPIYVRGYYSTNTWGNGWFEWRPTSFATNLGTIFTNTLYGGQWIRHRPEGTNYWKLEWFPITPMNTDDPTTRRPSDREFTNMVALAGNHSIMVLPPWGIFFTNDMVFTNWSSRKLMGAGNAFGAKNVYPERSSWIAYQGPGGTNSVQLRLWNAYDCEISGISFEMSTPVPTGIGYYPTNSAQLALDLDQFPGGGQISTGNRILNNTFRSRSTNVFAGRLTVSRTSSVNCENFLIEGNYFVGGGNADFVATGNSGYAILIGSSPNSRAHIIRNTTWSSTQYGLICSNGGFTFSGGLGDSASINFKLSAWTAPLAIEDFFAESSRQAFWIGTGAGGGGGKSIPVHINNYHDSHAQSIDGLALIELHGSAQIDLQNSAFYNEAFPNQQVFTNDPGFSATLYSRGVQYGINYSKDSPILGLTNFASVDFVSENDVNSGIPFSMRANWTYEIIDTSGPVKTNRELFRVNGAALQFSRTNSRVQIGNVPGAIALANLAVAANSASVAVDIGDTEIVSRLKLNGDGAGGTLLAINATNGRSSGLLLREETGADLMRLESGFGANQFRFGGAPFRFMSSASGGSSGQVAMQISENTAITLSPTNEAGAGVTIVASNVVIAATNLDVQTPSLTATGVVHAYIGYEGRTNTTANVPPAPRFPGDYFLGNTNGVAFILLSGLQATWQNHFVLGAASGGGYSGWETNDALANSFKSTNVLIAVGGIHATQANNTLNPIVGATDGGNAAAGIWGEYQSSAIASGGAVSLTDATAANITSISLTAGDWDVEGNVNIAGATATYSQGVAGISATSATLPTDGTEVYSGAQFTLLSVTDGVALPRKRINVTVTTTVYLVGRASFSAGTMTGYGSITARRAPR